MSDERKAPESPPEYPPETTGTRWLPIAEVEDLIGKKERNARYWLDRQAIPSRGDRPKLFSEEAIRAKLAELGQSHRKTPEHISEATGIPPEYTSETTGIPPEYPPEGTGMYSEPIEAAYRVAGEAAAEVALVPLATMVKELRGLADQLAELARRNEALALEVGTLRERQVGHEGQLTAQDETIATKEQVITTQRAALATKDQALAADAVAIVELRRRAETAEAERDRLMAAQAAPDAPGLTEAPTPGSPSPDAPAGFWARVRRVFGGE